MLADNSFPLRSKDAYSDRLMKVSHSRRGGLLRLTSGRAATSRTSFLHREGVAGKFGHRSIRWPTSDEGGAGPTRTVILGVRPACSIQLSYGPSHH